MTRIYQTWLQCDLMRARVWYEAGLPHAEIGRRLGRTAASVQQALQHHGLLRARPRIRERRLRTLLAKGLSDREIARRLRVARATVQRWRVRLGLDANGKPPGEGRKHYRAACHANGVNSLVELRWIRRELAREARRRAAV